VVTFNNNSTNTSIFNWNFGNGTTINVNDPNPQSITYFSEGVYTVILTAGTGNCTDQDTLEIIVLPAQKPTIEVPNVFTPNGDNTNDQFLIHTTNMKDLEVTILDRWGVVMCEYNGTAGFWDGESNGKEANEGVYFYIYKATGVNGDVLEGHGHVTLLR
jgi:gliding motility-associated-like protein